MAKHEVQSRRHISLRPDLESAVLTVKKGIVAVLKIGRNDPCFCGSGKKFKKCHGAKGGPARTDSAPLPAPAVEKITKFDLTQLKDSDCCPCKSGKTFGECHRPTFRRIQEENATIQAARQQHEEQFGEVRPPVHITFAGHRFVGVGNELHWAKESEVRTVPDFLIRFLGAKLGEEWRKAELAKPLDQRHPITQWYAALVELRRNAAPSSGETVSLDLDGPSMALMLLAYDIFVLQDNKALERRMLQRIKRPDHFQGARHELFAAATCIRAGFDITLERETDLARKHPEFTAVHRHTGQQIALEAKSRQWPGVLGFRPDFPKIESREARVRNLLLTALEKDVEMPFVVFIDVNLDPGPIVLTEPLWFREVVETVTSEFTPERAPEPFSLLFFSNHPHHYGERGKTCPPISGLNFLAPRPRFSATHPEAILRIAEEAGKWGRIPNDFPVYPGREDR